MNTKTAYSNKNNVKYIIKDIKLSFEGVNPKLIVYFASPSIDPKKLSKAMKKTFNKSLIIGASSHAEIADDKFSKNSVVAMALSEDVIEEAYVVVADKLDKDVDASVKKAFEKFEKNIGKSINDLDFTKYVGLILVDGLSGKEESVIEKIGDLTDILFVGGSAGDDLSFTGTYVYVNGKTYQNAAALALIKPKNGFEVLKTQSFKVLDKKLTVTKTDETGRVVIEFNGEPAAEAYAKALGVTVEELNDKLFSNPLGLIVGDEPYTRSPANIVNGTEVKFFCNLIEGTEYNILEIDDVVTKTQKAFEEKRKEIGNIDSLIQFNCVLRTIQLEQANAKEEYTNIFSGIPNIGFSTYGEQYLGHINQTATILLLK